MKQNGTFRVLIRSISIGSQYDLSKRKIIYDKLIPFNIFEGQDMQQGLMMGRNQHLEKVFKDQNGFSSFLNFLSSWSSRTASLFFADHFLILQYSKFSVSWPLSR